MSGSSSNCLSPNFLLQVGIGREENRDIPYETRIDIENVAAVSASLADGSETIGSGGTNAATAARLVEKVDVQTDHSNPQTDHSNPQTDRFYKVITATFVNTAAASYSMLSSTSPPTKSVVAATAAGFFGTLTAISLRDKLPYIARTAGKMGVLAGTVGVIGCYGLELPSEVYWALICAVAAVVPAAAVFYA